MEEFADFLRELQSDTSDSNDNRVNGKKSKKSRKTNDNITSQFLENQQLSFQLASDVRSLRQQLADEKQSNNVNLEAQMQKLEQKQVTLEQALRISENRRMELQSKYEEEVCILYRH